jgi:hypothetical protein
MIEMSAELHDKYSLGPQFITQLIGRILGQQKLKSTPIDTKSFKHALSLAEISTTDSFDHFFTLYQNAANAADHIARYVRPCISMFVSEMFIWMQCSRSCSNYRAPAGSERSIPLRPS